MGDFRDNMGDFRVNALILWGKELIFLRRNGSGDSGVTVM